MDQRRDATVGGEQQTERVEPTHMEKIQSLEAQTRALDAGLDNDTVQYGTDGPFNYWESDHTALVHVLWNLKHDGFTLAADADKIASRIIASRWLAAVRDEARG